MPDFDTQKPQEPNEPSRLRIALIADKLRALLITTKLRIPSIANGLRSLLIANKLRALSIGGVSLLLVGVTVAVGLPIYSSSGIGDGRHGSRIVFALDGDIWTMNADGSDMERLTYTGGGAEAPAPVWSPDGEKIAFTREVQKQSAYPRGGPYAVPHLFVMDADGSDQIEIASAPEGADAYEPSWSPGGRRIAFSSDTYCDIFIANADGSGAAKELSTPGFSGCSMSPEWSPDGGRIAFAGDPFEGNHINVYDNRNIYVLNVSPEGDTSGLRRLTNNRSIKLYPAWSPDGIQIAFASYRTSGWDIYKIDVRSLRVTRFTHSPLSNEVEPTWSPDGEHIAYVNLKQHSTHASIYRMDSDGSNSTPIFEVERKEVSGPDWGP